MSSSVRAEFMSRPGRHVAPSMQQHGLRENKVIVCTTNFHSEILMKIGHDEFQRNGRLVPTEM